MWQAASERSFKPNLNILRQLRVKRRQQRALAAHKNRCTKNVKDLEQLDTFHRAIRPYLCLAQIFGMLPLANVLSSNPQDIKFRIRSSGMCFSVLFLLLGGVKTTRIAIKIYQGGINSRNIVGLVFFTSGLIICLKFICFARCWHRLIIPWNDIDIIMLFPPYAPTKRSLRRKLLITGCLFGCLALIDHFLYYASSYYNYRMQIFHCFKNVTEIPFSSYVKREFADIFEILPYNPIFIFYAYFLNGTFVFIWNFMDTFIILISIGLAQRFKQFAQRILKLTNRQVPDALWFELRKHHILLCELMDLVDANMSGIVLISCLNNIYFICNKLLTIFFKLRYSINYAYYWYSLIFLLGRTCAVFLCASRINEFSLLPLEILYMVSSDNWTEEVQRFTHQLNNQYIALSGFRLFYLTRMSFFGMMSTLVYYEFMLLQLNAKAHKAELPDLCEMNFEDHIENILKH